MPVRNARAVVCRGPDRPFEVETIHVEPPRRNEVTIRLAACGVCHSDLSATNGTIPMPPPLVLGHEGAGVVVEIGEGVTELAVGDSVVTSFVSMCGHCRYCQTGRPQLCDQAARTLTTLPDGSVRSFDTDNQPLSVFSGCGVMAEFATLHVDNVVKIDAAMPLEPACLIACGVMTGVGAAFNTARVEAGSSVVVFGCGGVGLNAIQGSSIAGAASIIAVDTMAHKLEFARLFGATHTIDASTDSNVVKIIKKLTGGGVDYAFECVGLGVLVAQAYASLRKGGTAVVVGVAAQADTTSVRTASLTFEEKTLTGSMYGSARPRQDFPRLIALYRSGRLKLDELITQRYTIEQAAQAFADLQAGHNARGVIVFDPD
ncbi:MAG: alcohol dehydrogenase [Thiomonas sp. 20-64-9]|jgi:S-(hydroxymethyl)glutathione dehydrogenase/alcohol dehydrogenase|uniref:Zn-dependent alcohol dehydrogenase n=1 Tax=unclassified Thiomonas TaxID=2625466 RepID=UPI000B0523D4|nr:MULTISPECIES: Zn-dependent alcohol dehydrogenase [unclassified Thiomonas]OYV30120.1 MAG: alcohol dehydrogenase [Thiomonas sp. 20-64-9]OZB70822.1 MAG: alcohol dehydrogenase [Thiomonas sp. 13-64-67]